MSYRALKRLLGESGLERKCRVLLGAGTAILVAVSFWVYARQIEDVAKEQLQQTGRTLSTWVVTRIHVADPAVRDGLEEYQRKSEREWKDTWKDFTYRILVPGSSRPETSAVDDGERRTLDEFVKDPGKTKK